MPIDKEPNVPLKDQISLFAHNTEEVLVNIQQSLHNYPVARKLLLRRLFTIQFDVISNLIDQINSGKEH